MFFELYEEAKGGIKKELIKRVIESVFCHIKKSGPVAVHLVSSNKIKTLNKKYRGINKDTDVLSFPMEEATDWGDIFICIPKIKKQAKEFGVTFEEEFKRMLIHGVLHLAGFDHQKKDESKKMFEIQESILNKNL